MIKEIKNINALYDVGGVFIIVYLLGIPVGSIFDYLWNLIVLSIALSILNIHIAISRKLLYSLIITILGLIIDWAYFELTWDTQFAKSAFWSPAMPQALQFVCLILPIVMLSLVNFALSYAYLRLDKRQAIILGIVMGVFTAPWLLPTIPYIFGWAQ